MADPTNQQHPNQKRSGLLVGFFALVLLGIVAMNYWAGPQEGGSAGPPKGTPVEQTSVEQTPVDPAVGVTLTVEIPRHPSEAIVVLHRSEMTVLDLLREAASQSVEWRFRYEGRDAGAFLTELAGQGNEGTKGRNWTYQVNGQGPADSFGLYELSPGDQVLWKFAPYE